MTLNELNTAPQRKSNAEAKHHPPPPSLQPQHSAIHTELMWCVYVLPLVHSVILLCFNPQPYTCLEMYTRVHKVDALSELATHPLRRLALLTACPLLVTVCMADCADVSVDIHCSFCRQQSVVGHNGPNYLSQTEV